MKKILKLQSQLNNGVEMINKNVFYFFLLLFITLISPKVFLLMIGGLFYSMLF